MSGGRTVRRLATLLAALWLGLGSVAAGAQPLVADLASHLIGITSGFTGTQVVLFGATDGPGDIVAVVRGPERAIAVRHKRRIAGIWVNARAEVFPSVPIFYSIASSRPLDLVTTPAMRNLYQLGLDGLRLEAGHGTSSPEARVFRDALIAAQQRDHLYPLGTGKIEFLGDRLFRTTLAFPANVPTGTYVVEVLLIRDHQVVSGQTTPLVISKIGLDADITDLADRQPALYGAIAVLTAIVAGWLASVPFRNA